MPTSLEQLAAWLAASEGPHLEFKDRIGSHAWPAAGSTVVYRSGYPTAMSRCGKWIRRTNRHLATDCIGFDAVLWLAAAIAAVIQCGKRASLAAGLCVGINLGIFWT